MPKHHRRSRRDDDDRDQHDKKRFDHKERRSRRPRRATSRITHPPLAEDELESFLLENEFDDDFDFAAEEFFGSDDDADSDFDDTEH